MAADAFWHLEVYQRDPAAFYARLKTRDEQDRLRRIDAEIHYATLAQEAEKKRRRAAQEQAS